MNRSPKVPSFLITAVVATVLAFVRIVHMIQDSFLKDLKLRNKDSSLVKVLVVAVKARLHAHGCHLLGSSGQLVGSVDTNDCGLGSAFVMRRPIVAVRGSDQYIHCFQMRRRVFSAAVLNKRSLVAGG